MHILGAGITRIDTTRISTGMPVIYGGIILHARISTLPRGIRNPRHDIGCLQTLHRLLLSDRFECPVVAVLNRIQKILCHPDRIVGVLKLNRTPRITVQGHIPTGITEGVCFPLLISLTPYELHYVGMVNVQNNHLSSPPGLATRLDRSSYGISRPHEGHRTGSLAASRKHFLGGTNPGKIHSSP